jgi:excisionase family DNA binding protein
MTMKPNKTINLADYITADEAAKIAGLTGRRIRQLLTEGIIEGVKAGRSWLANRKSLDCFLAERRK